MHARVIPPLFIPAPAFFSYESLFGLFVSEIVNALKEGRVGGEEFFEILGSWIVDGNGQFVFGVFVAGGRFYNAGWRFGVGVQFSPAIPWAFGF